MIKLSYSACMKYLQSPRAYFLHYYTRLREIKTGSALIFGGALDLGLNSLLQDKMDGKPADIDKAMDVFHKEFNKTSLADIKFSKADLDMDLVPEAHRDSTTQELSSISLQEKGRILIEEYAVQIIPKIEQVLFIQKTINLPNHTGDVLTGAADFGAIIDGKRTLIDNKSTSVTYKENSANESEQLATYFEALKEEYGLTHVAYIAIPKKIRKVKKPRVEISIIFGQVTEQLLDQTFEKYDKVLTGIKLGEFPCRRTERDGCCSMPWPCTFRAYCESGGVDKSGLVVKESK